MSDNIIFELSSSSSSLSSSLNIDGYLVIPLLSPSEVIEYREELLSTHWPEMKNQSHEIFLGSFGCSGLPSTFHHPIVREIRNKAFKSFQSLVFPFITEQDEKFHLLFDRLCVRMKGTKCSAEKWHQDNSPCDPDDRCLGGWCNLDQSDQFFSCIPSTHSYKGLNGFAELSDKECENIFKTHKQESIRVPPGHWIMFFNSIIHEIHPRKMTFDSLRLFIGIRMSKLNYHLFDYDNNPNLKPFVSKDREDYYHNDDQQYHFDLNTHITDQGIMPVPSGDLSPNYYMYTFTARRPQLATWSKNLKECCKRVVTTQKGSSNTVVHRYLPSLREMNLPLYISYSDQERNQYITLHDPI
jgi:hypothetical protein